MPRRPTKAHVDLAAKMLALGVSRFSVDGLEVEFSPQAVARALMPAAKPVDAAKAQALRAVEAERAERARLRDELWSVGDA